MAEKQDPLARDIGDGARGRQIQVALHERDRHHAARLQGAGLLAAPGHHGGGGEGDRQPRPEALDLGSQGAAGDGHGQRLGVRVTHQGPEVEHLAREGGLEDLRRLQLGQDQGGPARGGLGDVSELIQHLGDGRDAPDGLLLEGDARA